MKFYCKYCKLIIVRDMRQKANKIFMTKKGYKSYCDYGKSDVFLQPLKS